MAAAAQRQARDCCNANTAAARPDERAYGEAANVSAASPLTQPLPVRHRPSQFMGSGSPTSASSSWQQAGGCRVCSSMPKVATSKEIQANANDRKEQRQQY